MTDRTHEFISAGSEIDPSAPLYPFKQSYNINRVGKLNRGYDYSADLDQDEIRPGMDEIEGAFYDAAFDKNEHINKICGEYGDHNLRFWGFIFGALAVSILAFVSIYMGSDDRLFTALEEPSFSPLPKFVIAGLVAFFFLTGFVCYHNWKDKNGPTFRHGCLFLMVFLWGLTLWWTVLFYAQHSEKDASFVLFLCITVLVIWIWLITCRAKYDKSKLWLLVLGLVWLSYLFYYNVGILNNNDLPLNFIPDSGFGDRGNRTNRFERFRRHTIV